MTDDERDAREWLNDAKNERLQRHNYLVSACYSPDDDAKHRATILALLDRPTLPHPDSIPVSLRHQIMKAYLDAHCGQDGLSAALKAHYDHYAQPPAPKPVEPAYNPDAEFAALQTVFGALDAVGEKAAVARVLRYMRQRFGLEDRDGR